MARGVNTLATRNQADCQTGTTPRRNPMRKSSRVRLLPLNSRPETPQGLELPTSGSVDQVRQVVE